MCKDHFPSTMRYVDVNRVVFRGTVARKRKSTIGEYSIPMYNIVFEFEEVLRVRCVSHVNDRIWRIGRPPSISTAVSRYCRTDQGARETHIRYWRS